MNACVLVLPGLIFFVEGGCQALKGFFFFVWEASRSFLHAWQSELQGGSENRHVAKPTEVVGNASAITYLRRENMHANPLSSSEGLGGGRGVHPGAARTVQPAVRPGHTAAILAWLAMNFLCSATFNQPFCR